MDFVQLHELCGLCPTEVTTIPTTRLRTPTGGGDVDSSGRHLRWKQQHGAIKISVNQHEFGGMSAAEQKCLEVLIPLKFWGSKDGQLGVLDTTSNMFLCPNQKMFKLFNYVQLQNPESS